MAAGLAAMLMTRDCAIDAQRPVGLGKGRIAGTHDDDGCQDSDESEQSFSGVCFHAQSPYRLSRTRYCCGPFRAARPEGLARATLDTARPIGERV